MFKINQKLLSTVLLMIFISTAVVISPTVLAQDKQFQYYEGLKAPGADIPTKEEKQVDVRSMIKLISIIFIAVFSLLLLIIFIGKLSTGKVIMPQILPLGLWGLGASVLLYVLVDRVLYYIAQLFR